MQHSEVHFFISRLWPLAAAVKNFSSPTPHLFLIAHTHDVYLLLRRIWRIFRRFKATYSM